MAVTSEQLEREILAQKPFFLDNTAIYMTGSNSFALPVGKLRKYISVLHKHFSLSLIDDILRSYTDNEQEMMVSHHLKQSL